MIWLPHKTPSSDKCLGDEAVGKDRTHWPHPEKPRVSELLTRPSLCLKRSPICSRCLTLSDTRHAVTNLAQCEELPAHSRCVIIEAPADVKSRLRVHPLKLPLSIKY